MESSGVSSGSAFLLCNSSHCLIQSVLQTLNVIFYNYADTSLSISAPTDVLSVQSDCQSCIVDFCAG